MYNLLHSRMVGMNDSRREEPENFRLIFGGLNISDIEEDGGVEGSEQILSIDMIIKGKLFYTA